MEEEVRFFFFQSVFFRKVPIGLLGGLFSATDCPNWPFLGALILCFGLKCIIYYLIVLYGIALYFIASYGIYFVRLWYCMVSHCIALYLM